MRVNCESTHDSFITNIEHDDIKFDQKSQKKILCASESLMDEFSAHVAPTQIYKVMLPHQKYKTQSGIHI